MPSTKKFFSELAALLNKRVIVRTVQGHSYEGVLLGFDANNLHVCLKDVKDEKGSLYPRVFILGGVIGEILSKEELIDLKELAQRIERVFPHMVSYYEDARVIVVMNKVKVTEEGVVEGSGPIAERVRKIFEEYITEKRARSTQ